MKKFADCAALDEIAKYAAKPYIEGVTTNPTLMHQAGINSYRDYADAVLDVVPVDKAVSFEVVGDTLDDVHREALEISSWGSNVFAKIPVTLTNGTPTWQVTRALSHAGVKVNVTAVMAPSQIPALRDAFHPDVPAIVSVFAGRLADLGWDPEDVVFDMRLLLPKYVDVLWASTREIFSIVVAEDIGCDIITLTPALIEKLPLLESDLTPEAYSLLTVKQFRGAAVEAGLVVL